MDNEKLNVMYASKGAIGFFRLGYFGELAPLMNKIHPSILWKNEQVPMY